CRLVDVALREAKLAYAHWEEVTLGFTERGAVLDARGADLRGFYGAGASLERAILSMANLEGATLIDAQLGLADLRQANLVDADLSGAVLVEANLGGCDLRGAVLKRTNFAGANLAGSNLEGADLRD